MKAIYGKKIGMTRIFTAAGESIPATVIETTPNTVFQVKTAANDGYDAVQIGIGTQKPQRVNRPLSRHVAKAEKGTPRELAEIRLSERNGCKKGLVSGGPDDSPATACLTGSIPSSMGRKVSGNSQQSTYLASHSRRIFFVNSASGLAIAWLSWLSGKHSDFVSMF